MRHSDNYPSWTTEQKAGILAQFPLLSVLDANSIRQIAESSQPQALPRGEIVFNSYHSAEKVFFLVSGMVKLCSKLENDRVLIKNLITPFQVMGESALMGHEKYDECAMAMNAGAEYLVVHKSVLHEIMAAHFVFFQAIIEHISVRLRKAEDQWEAILFKDVRTRLRVFIQDYASKPGIDGGFGALIQQGLTQQDIAHLIGASRQTVALALNEMRRKNEVQFGSAGFYATSRIDACLNQTAAGR